ncbi:MAG: FtsX-like permease family protein [Bacteroidia bacterium]|nr:FtsX-like permease family protein [Bacteroidia bacterium]
MLSFTLARRYLFSRKSSNAINIITWVAIVGIGVETAALILVLSVFNGLTRFIEDLFAAIDPDIKVVAAAGQTFTDDPRLYDTLAVWPGVAAATRTLEGRVWLEYVDKQTIATIKGVAPDFTEVNPLDTFVYQGRYTFKPRLGISQGILGAIIADRLSANLDDETSPVMVAYIPQSSSFTNPENTVNTDVLLPSGFFSVQKEYDEKYVFADLEYVRNLFGTTDQISAYELRLIDMRDTEIVQEELQAMLGPDYEVLTWYEQHQTLYRVMKNEKYISYLILVLMLTLASVNIVGSLSMIIVEKTRDIAVLKAQGATSGFIRSLFLGVGILVGGVGGVAGVVLALVIGLAQEHWGLVTLQGGESFRVKAFPIELIWTDFALVFGTVMVLAVLASLYPASQAARIKVVEGLRQ